MGNTPSIISIGRRCVDFGYSFRWDVFEVPILICPSGRTVKLDVINNVPYLPKGPVMFGAPNLDACPAMPAMPGPVLALNDELYPAAPSEADAPDEGGEIIEVKHPEGYRTEAQLRAEAKTLQHMMTHLPKNPFCTHCQRAKMENVRLHRRGGADAHECTKFGDIVTVDTMVLHGLKDRGVNGETDAVVFYDLATKYIDVLPVFSRSVPNTVEAFHKFMGPEPKIGLLYSDQAREFLAATRRMAWVHHMSTPGMPKTNGIIENKVNCTAWSKGTPQTSWLIAQVVAVCRSRILRCQESRKSR